MEIDYYFAKHLILSSYNDYMMCKLNAIDSKELITIRYHIMSGRTLIKSGLTPLLAIEMCSELTTKILVNFTEELKSDWIEDFILNF